MTGLHDHIGGETIIVFSGGGGDEDDDDDAAVVSCTTSVCPSDGMLVMTPTTCVLYSADSIRKIYGIIESIWTLPINPAKNNSSMTAGLRRRNAGNRINNFTSRSGSSG